MKIHNGVEKRIRVPAAALVAGVVACNNNNTIYIIARTAAVPTSKRCSVCNRICP